MRCHLFDLLLNSVRAEIPFSVFGICDFFDCDFERGCGLEAGNRAVHYSGCFDSSNDAVDLARLFETAGLLADSVRELLLQAAAQLPELHGGRHSVRLFHGRHFQPVRVARAAVQFPQEEHPHQTRLHFESKHPRTAAVH